jgi:hypothetical protein
MSDFRRIELARDGVGRVADERAMLRNSIAHFELRAFGLCVGIVITSECKTFSFGLCRR